MERLDKLLAATGKWSRKEAKALIKAGRVRVEDRLPKGPEDKVEEGSLVTVDGKPIFTDYVMKNPDGLSPKNAIGTFTFAQSSGPFILSQDEVTQLDDESVNRAKQDCIIPFLEESKKYVIPGSTSFSSEDDAVRRAVMADVDTYVDEMIIKFVSGREPLSNWDTYVEKVNGMGIAEVIDIYQKTLNG